MAPYSFDMQIYSKSLSTKEFLERFYSVLESFKVKRCTVRIRNENLLTLYELKFPDATQEQKSAIYNALCEQKPVN